jgi:Flp pilus assembly protein TadG
MFAAFTQRLARSAGRLRSCKFWSCRPFARGPFARCDNGTAAVEFAIVAAPFFGILVALLQTSMVFLAQRVLDETADQVSRYIMTGQAQSASMTQSQFATYVCQNTFALFSCSNYMINVQNYSSFSAANTTTPTLTFDAQGAVTNQWSWAPGTSGDIVVVQIMYQWPVMLGPLGFDLANLSNGNRLLVSTIAFKNEPYSDTE